MALSTRGSLTSTGPSVSVFRPSTNHFNLHVWGTFTGSYKIERSLDGTNWFPCTAVGADVIFTAPISEVLYEPDLDVSYRLNVAAISSGTINFGFGP